jgi:hypothetical protein
MYEIQAEKETIKQTIKHVCKGRLYFLYEQYQKPKKVPIKHVGGQTYSRIFNRNVTEKAYRNEKVV